MNARNRKTLDLVNRELATESASPATEVEFESALDNYRENEADALKQARKDDDLDSFWDNAAGEIAESIITERARLERQRIRNIEALPLMRALYKELVWDSDRERVLDLVLRVEQLSHDDKLPSSSSYMDFRKAAKHHIKIESWTLTDLLKERRAQRQTQPTVDGPVQ